MAKLVYYTLLFSISYPPTFWVSLFLILSFSHTSGVQNSRLIFLLHFLMIYRYSNNCNFGKEPIFFLASLSEKKFHLHHKVLGNYINIFFEGIQIILLRFVCPKIKMFAVFISWKMISVMRNRNRHEFINITWGVFSMKCKHKHTIFNKCAPFQLTENCLHQSSFSYYIPKAKLFNHCK